MGCGEGAIGIGWTILGMGLCVLASVGSTFGLILQKMAHVKQEERSEEDKWPEVNGMMCSPYWVVGLVLLVAVPFPLDMVAFTLAPQSLVVPLTGVTLVLNQVVAPWLLNEKLTRLDWIGTGIICCGIVCATAFGTHCSYTYTLQQIVDLFEETVFIVCEVGWVILCIFCSMWVLGGAEMYYTDQGPIDRSRSVAFAILSGSVGGQQQIFLKATGEMLESSFDGRGEWDRFEPYVFILCCAGFAVGQIMLLNKGLVLWTAVKYLPIYNVSLILCSTTFGAIFYKEYEALDTTGIIMFPLGVAIVIVGSLMLALKQETSIEVEQIASHRYSISEPRRGSHEEENDEENPSKKEEGYDVQAVGEDKSEMTTESSPIEALGHGEVLQKEQAMTTESSPIEALGHGEVLQKEQAILQKQDQAAIVVVAEAGAAMSKTETLVIDCDTTRDRSSTHNRRLSYAGNKINLPPLEGKSDSDLIDKQLSEVLKSDSDLIDEQLAASQQLSDDDIKEMLGTTDVNEP